MCGRSRVWWSVCDVSRSVLDDVPGGVLRCVLGVYQVCYVVHSVACQEVYYALF